MDEIVEAPLDQCTLRSLIEVIHDPAYVLDASGLILHVNRAALNAWPEVPAHGIDLAAQPLADFLRHPDGSPMPYEETPAYRTLVYGEVMHDVEIVVQIRGQEPRHVRVSSSPLYNGATIAGAIMVARTLDAATTHSREMSERNSALQALNDLAAHLLRKSSEQEVYEAALDGMLHIAGASRGGIMVADDALQQMDMRVHRGFSPETLAQVSPGPYTMPTDHNRARETGEIFVLHPDRTTEIGQFVLQQEHIQTAVLIPVPQGDRIVGVLSYVLAEYRDPTDLEREILRTGATYIGAALERVQLFEAAQAERVRLGRILEEMPTGILIATGEPETRTMQWTFINRTAREQLAAPTVTPGANSETFSIYHPDGTPFLDEDLPIQRALWREPNDAHGPNELVFRYNDGRERYFLATLTTLSQEGGTREVVEALQEVTELKRLEEQVRLHAQEIQAEYEKLAAVVSNVDVALAVMDNAGRMTMVNDAWLRYNNRERKDVLGKTLGEITDHEAADAAQAAIDRVLTTGEPMEVQEFFVPYAAKYTETGRPGIYLDWSLLPVKGPDGSVDTLLNVTVDVTEKVLARKEVEQQKALLETIFDSAPVGLLMLDRDQNIVSANPEWERLSGLSLEKVKGLSIFEALPGSRQFSHEHRRVLAGERIDLEYVMVPSPIDGSERWRALRMRPVRNSDDEIVGMLVAGVDVTANVRSRQDLEAQRTMLQTIVEGTPVGIALYDADLRLIDLNHTWASLVGVDLEEARGKRAGDMFPSDLMQHDALRQALAGETVDSINVAHRHPVTGETLAFDLHYRPVRNHEGKVTGILNAMVDVTERHRLETRKDEFIALTSHELKTPITAIKGFAQLGITASGKLGDARLARTLSVINEQTDKLTRLINELMDVSRLQSGQLELTREHYDLRQQLTELVENVGLTRADFRLALQAPDEALTVYADRHRVEQAILNLLQNAIKYSGESRDVEIEARRSGSEAILRVRDYGVGIPASQQERVFERFFRASNVAEHDVSGLGLGLFISHGIVARHQGRMWLESREGEGSTFYMALPLAPEA